MAIDQGKLSENYYTEYMIFMISYNIVLMFCVLNAIAKSNGEVIFQRVLV